MHLSKVEIRNFRCLKDVTVELQPGLNVLVGRNGIGKTNLFDAIRQAIGPSGARGETVWLERDDFHRASAAAEPEATMSVTLTFSDLSEAQRSHFFEIVDFDLADLPKSKAILRFEASWPKGKRQATIKRTGGPPTVEPPEVPARLLESLPISFLPALRDAAACLAPGHRSRLALLLRDLGQRRGEETQGQITAIYQEANERLESHPLISGVKQSLQETTRDLAGTDYASSAIRAAEAQFERILRTLQVQMDTAPIGSLDANGLGYNNLLYMAVVLEHLKCPEPDECALLLVEEPEAHLHPQLTALLADYLANKTPGARTPQTIVSTHSPVLAAKVPPGRVHVLFTDMETRQPRCNSVAKAGMTEKEGRELERMLDITRATLYFAKGLILTEGISEALLLPIFAKRLRLDLESRHVAVIPICGVAFETFKKLLDPSVLGIPVAIITDADPPVIRGQTWETDCLEKNSGSFAVSDRTTKLLDIFRGHPTVGVYPARVTLEFDLAEAGDDNARIMAEVWESCFAGTPRTFNREIVASASTREAKALAAWRGICRAEHTGSKAEFAHRLASRLEGTDGQGPSPPTFAIPQYIHDTIQHVVSRVDAHGPSSPPATGNEFPDAGTACDSR